MQLAFVLYSYFPFGGLQRDFLRIALECQNRGHSIRVYTISWQGAIPEGFDVVLLPAKAWTNHSRNEKFLLLLQQALQTKPVDCVIGFNKMPGLDFYYAADICYQAKSAKRNKLYRMLPRYKHYLAFEQAVFDVANHTQILMISEPEQAVFEQYYQTPKQRFHLLPPGINPDRKAPSNAAQIRQQFRKELYVPDDEFVIVQIGSGFKTKGLDRSIVAFSALPKELQQKSQLIVIGQDNEKPFIHLAQTLEVAHRVRFMGGRDDVAKFLLAADILIHPAYNENTGTVLLEALVAGLPVLVTDVCGYASYINDADCGVILASPFNQEHLNHALLQSLQEPRQRQQWSKNALSYAEHADLYSMPEKAADVILGNC